MEGAEIAGFNAEALRDAGVRPARRRPGRGRYVGVLDPFHPAHQAEPMVEGGSKHYIAL
jgi:hypothetical protein